MNDAPSRSAAPALRWAGGPGMPVEEAASWAGGSAWTEARLFELFGAWSLRSGDPSWAVPWLATWSRRHGRHAELWGALLPRSVPFLDPEGLLAPPDGGRDESVGRLVRPQDGQDAPGALLSLVAMPVLAWLAGRYERHRALAAPLADGPALRVLDLVQADLAHERSQLSAFLAGPAPGR